MVEIKQITKAIATGLIATALGSAQCKDPLLQPGVAVTLKLQTTTNATQPEPEPSEQKPDTVVTLKPSKTSDVEAAATWLDKFYQQNIREVSKTQQEFGTLQTYGGSKRTTFTITRHDSLQDIQIGDIIMNDEEDPEDEDPEDDVNDLYVLLKDGDGVWGVNGMGNFERLEANEFEYWHVRKTQGYKHWSTGNRNNPLMLKKLENHIQKEKCKDSQASLGGVEEKTDDE